MEKINAGVFLKVVKTGSFKAAATHMGYTQAGISYIINSMENELGLKLFIREYGGVKLSPEGKELFYYLEQIHINEKLLKATADEMRSLNSGSVSVRSFSSVSIHWLPGIIEKFNQKYPNIKVTIVSTDNDIEAEAMVSNQTVDCGFFALPLNCDFETVFLHDSPMMVSISPKHPLAKLDNFPIEELCNYPFIKMSYDDSEHYLQELFNLAGGIPRESYIIDNDYAALAMASKNMGYCLFPKMTLKNVPFDLKHLDLIPHIAMKVCIGAKSLSRCSRATKEFVKCASEWVAEHVD